MFLGSSCHGNFGLKERNRGTILSLIIFADLAVLFRVLKFSSNFFFFYFVTSVLSSFAKYVYMQKIENLFVGRDLFGHMLDHWMQSV